MSRPPSPTRRERIGPFRRQAVRRCAEPTQMDQPFCAPRAAPGRLGWAVLLLAAAAALLVIN